MVKKRSVGAMAGLILSTSLVGCGEQLDDDVAVEADLLSIIVAGRPMADAPFPAPPTNPPRWSVQPSSLARFDAINETSCNNATDYIAAGKVGPNSLFKSAAFDIDVSRVPVGKTVSSMQVIVCARLHDSSADGGFFTDVRYWDPTGVGQRRLVGNEGEFYSIPAVGPFGANPFRQYKVPTRVVFDIVPAAKTATSGMRALLSGDNLDISQFYLSIGYPTNTPF